ncbi:hypothetical protein [Hymenobacter sp. YC55]|uniref:hypothetical protein n=1 Tax=Hymenobacter sp. YC55 TaxID=3034019 RepID=UPI0023F84B17|nr:hypothetical protein [Hymenobacter sp. YC55]MDF7814483.1 hypothetical protein [Hymenobacter sp. YC55]
MAALGIAIVYFIYAVLGSYMLYWIARFFEAATFAAKRGCLIRSSIGAILFTCFAGNNYRNQQSAETGKVGVYQLSAYPGCSSCLLELKPDNYYEVRQGQMIKERGPWRYESGGDYWIVYLNKDDQLGTGKYHYQNYR